MEIENIEVEIEPTSRGFLRLEFGDMTGERCSLQESSLATADAIWLGQNRPTVLPGGQMSCRMHLSRDHARMLLPLLQRFVETGSPFENGKPSNEDAGGPGLAGAGVVAHIRAPRRENS